MCRAAGAPSKSMASMGSPQASTSGSGATASPASMRLGPPFRMSARTLPSAASCCMVMSCGCISLYTPRLRTSRATRALSSLPRSNITTISCVINYTLPFHLCGRAPGVSVRPCAGAGAVSARFFYYTCFFSSAQRLRPGFCARAAAFCTACPALWRRAAFPKPAKRAETKAHRRGKALVWNRRPERLPYSNGPAGQTAHRAF